MGSTLANGILWVRKDPRATMDHLGFIPDFLSANDRRPARKQIAENYAHGGGWHPNEGGRVLDGGRFYKYPGDAPRPLLWEARLARGEIVRVYDGALVTITYASGDFEAALID